MNYFIDGLKRFKDFSGRARRKEYWMFALFNMIVLVICIVLDNFLGLANKMTGYGPLYMVGFLVTLVPSIAVGVRRMHDVGKSGWFLLIPFYNLYLAIKEGDKGENQYGADPKVGTSL